MNKVFNIDYKRLIVLLLPTFLRKPVLYSLLKAMISPVISLYDAFLTNRAQNIYKANINGQVCHLRGMLNDNFDNDQRRIYISNGSTNGWCFAFMQALFNTQGNKQPIWAGSADKVNIDTLGNKTFVFNQGNTGVLQLSKQGAIGANGMDFVVMVPVALREIVDEVRMTSLVNYYKLASKRYDINYY